MISCFQELFQEYVVTSESHTVCRMDGCDKDYRDRKCLVRHIGSTHNKVSSEDFSLDFLNQPISNFLFNANDNLFQVIDT